MQFAGEVFAFEAGDGLDVEDPVAGFADADGDGDPVVGHLLFAGQRHGLDRPGLGPEFRMGKPEGCFASAARFRQPHRNFLGDSAIAEQPDRDRPVAGALAFDHGGQPGFPALENPQGGIDRNHAELRFRDPHAGRFELNGMDRAGPGAANPAAAAIAGVETIGKQQGAGQWLPLVAFKKCAQVFAERRGPAIRLESPCRLQRNRGADGLGQRHYLNASLVGQLVQCGRCQHFLRGRPAGRDLVVRFGHGAAWPARHAGGIVEQDQETGRHLVLDPVPARRLQQRPGQQQQEQGAQNPQHPQLGRFRPVAPDRQPDHDRRGDQAAKQQPARHQVFKCPSFIHDFLRL